MLLYKNQRGHSRRHSHQNQVGSKLQQQWATTEQDETCVNVRDRLLSKPKPKIKTVMK